MKSEMDHWSSSIDCNDYKTVQKSIYSTLVEAL